MRLALLSLLVSLGCGSRPNRACILAENALKQAHKEGSCRPISYGETTDSAVLSFDEGERMCHDDLKHGPKEGPFACDIMQPTKDEIADAAKARAEAEAKTNAELAAKLKVEAEAKARADVAAGSGSGSGSAKGPK